MPLEMFDTSVVPVIGPGLGRLARLDPLPVGRAAGRRAARRAGPASMYQFDGVVEPGLAARPTRRRPRPARWSSGVDQLAVR